MGITVYVALSVFLFFIENVMLKTKFCLPLRIGKLMFWHVNFRLHVRNLQIQDRYPKFLHSESDNLIPIY